MDEPIAWIKARELTYMKAVVEHGATEWKTNLGLKPEDGDVPLYTAPPQRGFIGLTDEEIMDICNFAKGQNGFSLSVKLKPS